MTVVLREHRDTKLGPPPPAREASDIPRWSSVYKPVYPQYIQTDSLERAFERVLRRELPIAFAEADLHWRQDPHAFDEIPFPRYIGVHCRIREGDRREVKIAEFYDELKQHLPAFGLIREDAAVMAGKLASHLERTVRVGDAHGFRDYLTRVSGLFGDTAREDQWHVDYQDEGRTQTLRSIATLHSVPILDPRTGRASSGSTFIFPTELLPEDRRRLITELLSQKGPNDSWHDVFTRLNDAVERWVAQDFKRFLVPTLPIGQAAFFLGGQDGLLHRAARGGEYLFRTVHSINARITAGPGCDE